MTQLTPITGSTVDSAAIICYNRRMANNTRSLDDIPVAYMMDDSWVWKDDMITFCDADDDDLEYELSWYDDGSADRILAELEAEMDHPICGEFPRDSIDAPRGWDKVDGGTAAPSLLASSDSHWSPIRVLSAKD